MVNNMKTNKRLIKTQRKSLDEKLRSFEVSRQQPQPKAGWIRALREALGMTSRQLAERLGIQQSGVILLEQREVKKTITLESLERAARAMNCDLVYALVPRESLEKTLDQQALFRAQQMIQRTVHTMQLEQQPVSEAHTSAQVEDLAKELKDKLDSRLWSKS